MRENPRTLKDRATNIAVSMLGDSSIEITVKSWAKVPEYCFAGGEIRKIIVETFRIRNIVIPFPRYELQMVEGTV
jgi:small conductance mechanosensitive channel